MKPSEVEQRVAGAARRAIRAYVAEPPPVYDRAGALARFLGYGPRELADTDRESARETVIRLAAMLRGERRRGRAGHWTYDLNRHIALARVLSAERERLARLDRAASPATHQRP